MHARALATAFGEAIRDTTGRVLRETEVGRDVVGREPGVRQESNLQPASGAFPTTPSETPSPLVSPGIAGCNPVSGRRDAPMSHVTVHVGFPEHAQQHAAVGEFGGPRRPRITAHSEGFGQLDGAVIGFSLRVQPAIR